MNSGFRVLGAEFLNLDSGIWILEYEIKKKGVYYKVVAKNSISALWLSGIFPKDPKKVLETNEYVLDDIKYKYSVKTKKLTK